MEAYLSYFYQELLFLRSFYYKKVSIKRSVQFEQVVSSVGGVFSGAGVSEGTQAGSFIFDPVAAGVGMHEVSYAIANDTFRSTINMAVANPPELNLPDTLRLRTPRLRLIPGLGTPQGGVYTDNNGYLVDDGNGQIFHISEMPPIAPTAITSKQASGYIKTP